MSTLLTVAALSFGWYVGWYVAEAGRFVLAHFKGKRPYKLVHLHAYIRDGHR